MSTETYPRTTTFQINESHAMGSTGTSSTEMSLARPVGEVPPRFFQLHVYYNYPSFEFTPFNM